MIANSHYEDKVEELKQMYTLSESDFYKSDHFGPYMAVSVGLTTFLPSLHKSQHRQMTQEIFYHRDLSYIDQFYPKKLRENLTIIDNEKAIEASKTSAQVFVTYHTGSYRLFIHHLLANNTPFCLVTQKDYIDSYGDISQEIVRQTKADKNSKLDIISAEDPRLLFQLKSKIENGVSVVFYIDGNTGVSEKENAENKNLSEIAFLNHRIYARQGIAFLAFITKAPIVTAICQRLEEARNILTIQYLDSNEIGQFTSRSEFINGVTKILYDDLSQFVSKHPEQWEGWFYLDKFYDKNAFRDELSQNQKSATSVRQKLSVSIDDMTEIFSYDGRYFIALKSDMRLLEINEHKYKIVQNFETSVEVIPNRSNCINGVDFSWQQIEELLDLSILKLTYT